ncbi:amidase [Caenimonas sp. SL110]|uniref:amidase n=1 Tax=Caenimonas sp. SL110 TaxID=1450524 RepID=UPI000652C78A|nr:amidase [Caenimonas sp. SL110]
MTDLWRLDAQALVQGFESGSFSPVDALESCMARAKASQSSINAFVHFDESAAHTAAVESARRWERGEPLGAIDGIPVSLKDNLHCAGMPTTWGSQLLRGFVAGQDELPVASLRAAGAVIFGKTNLPEFALQGITDNLVFGATRNPRNTQLTPGGSSGGAAAAVAAGCGPLALATDGGGSTRRPASHTGIVGFKPSIGLVARGGGLPEIFLDYEVPGVLARTAADAARMVMALAAPSAGSARSALSAAPALPESRILFVPTFAGHPVDPAIAMHVRSAAQRLSSMGHHIEESPPADWAEAINECWPVLSAAGLAWMLADTSRFPEFRSLGQPLDLSQCTPASRAIIDAGRHASGLSLFAAMNAVHALRARMQILFSRHDFLLLPATAALPWPIGQSHPGEIDSRAVGPRGHAVFTAFANAAGLPAIAMPHGEVDGLPTGIQLVARAGADMDLLSLAQQFESFTSRP